MLRVLVAALHPVGFRGKDGTASVILQRHAALWIELLEEPDEEPETRPPLDKPSAEKSAKEEPAEKSEA
ncbi:MAG: hypothetical protein ABGY41_13600 [Candidatus Poribacteria bacterium]